MLTAHCPWCGHESTGLVTRSVQLKIGLHAAVRHFEKFGQPDDEIEQYYLEGVGVELLPPGLFRYNPGEDQAGDSVSPHDAA